MSDGQPLDHSKGEIRDSNPQNKNDAPVVRRPCQIIGTPVFYKNRVYVTIGKSDGKQMPGRLTCIDATKTGDITRSGRVWSFDEMEESVSSVAIADGRLYVADIKGHLFCLNPDTGSSYWNCDMKAKCVWSTPMVADGKIYIGADNTLRVLAAGGTEARELAQIKLDSYCNGTVVAVNSTLFIASCKNLWAVQSGK